MHRLLILAALGALALAVGCGRNQAGDVPTPELSVEQTALLMLEALRVGDVQTFLDHSDLRGVYQRFPAAMRATFSYEQFLDAIDKAAAKLRGKKMEEMTYEIVSVEDRDDIKLVTVKVREKPGKSLRTYEVYFGRFGDVWKITGEGVKDVTEKD